jgi:hypothetical protein
MHITEVKDNVVIALVPILNPTKEVQEVEVYGKLEDFTSWYVTAPGAEYRWCTERGLIIEDGLGRRKGFSGINVDEINKDATKDSTELVAHKWIRRYNDRKLKYVNKVLEGKLDPIPHVNDVNDLEECNKVINTLLEAIQSTIIIKDFIDKGVKSNRALESLGSLLLLYRTKERILKLAVTEEV